MIRREDFDLELAAALRGYVEEAPTHIDPDAYVRELTARRAALDRRRLLPSLPRSRTMVVVALVSLLTIALMGLAGVGGVRPPIAKKPSVIAFVAATYSFDGSGVRTESRSIYTVPPSGGTPIHVADVPTGGDEAEHLLDPEDTGPFSRSGPALHWSPDASSIAYAAVDPDTPREARGLYVVRLDDSEARFIPVEDFGVDPSAPEWTDSPWPGRILMAIDWSPSSREIAVVVSNPGSGPGAGGHIGNGGLYLVSVGAGSVTRLVDEAAAFVSWSPDGSRITFGRTIRIDPPDSGLTSAIVVVDPRGQNESVLFETHEAWHEVAGATWSPDGSRIAFHEQDPPVPFVEEDVWRLSVMNADGTGLSRIHSIARGCCLSGARPGSVAWSPDGTAVVAHLTVRGDHHAVDAVVLGLDGSVRARLDASGGDYVWSPDGTRLAYEGDGTTIPGSDPPTSVPNIMLIDADGAGRHRLASGDSPAWSP